MIISTASEKHFAKSNTSSWLKHLITRNRVILPQSDKGHLWKPITNTVLTDESVNTFPLRSRIREDCKFLPLLFNTALEFHLGQIKTSNKRHPN